MDRVKRAKQFMPFAALRGYEELLLEQTKLYHTKRHVSEERQGKLSASLKELKKDMLLSVTYFEDGFYLTTTAKVSKVDFLWKELRLQDFSQKTSLKKEQVIPFKDLWHISQIV